MNTEDKSALDAAHEKAEARRRAFLTEISYHEAEVNECNRLRGPTVEMRGKMHEDHIELLKRKLKFLMCGTCRNVVASAHREDADGRRNLCVACAERYDRNNPPEPRPAQMIAGDTSTLPKMPGLREVEPHEWKPGDKAHVLELGWCVLMSKRNDRAYVLWNVKFFTGERSEVTEEVLGDPVEPTTVNEKTIDALRDEIAAKHMQDPANTSPKHGVAIRFLKEEIATIEASPKDAPLEADPEPFGNNPFKVGDHLECIIDPHDSGLYANDIYEVLRVNESGVFPGVRVSNLSNPDADLDVWLSIDFFEKVKVHKVNRGEMLVEIYSPSGRHFGNARYVAGSALLKIEGNVFEVRVGLLGGLELTLIETESGLTGTARQLIVQPRDSYRIEIEAEQ